jgi:hypothetical protein
MLDIEQSIRERAYQLWIEGGCQHGHADAHWLSAQREVLSASLSEIVRVAVASPKKARTPRKKKRAA